MSKADIERLARVVWENAGDCNGYLHNVEETARAVLRAIREPSAEALAALVDHVAEPHQFNSASALSDWQFMIDKLLEES